MDPDWLASHQRAFPSPLPAGATDSFWTRRAREFRGPLEPRREQDVRKDEPAMIGNLEVSREARMHKRVAMTVRISFLMAGWLSWTGPDVAAAQNRVTGTIPVPKGPHGLVITPDGRKVHVSGDGASIVSVIATISLGIDKDIPPKGKVEVAVVFPASGVLTFSCKFHGPLGMNGMLRVGE
jgi:hypothetical protein